MAEVVISANTTGAYAGDNNNVVDAQIKELAPNANYSPLETMEATKYAASDWTNSLIWFDLSDIPSGSTINNVELGLYVSYSRGVSTAGLRRLMVLPVISQATWSVYSTGSTWGVAGGMSDNQDRVESVSASAEIDKSGWHVFSSAQLIADVDAFISGINYGWHIERIDGQNDSDYIIFYSSETSDGLRPYLIINYAEDAEELSIPVAVNHYKQMGGM